MYFFFGHVLVCVCLCLPHCALLYYSTATSCPFNRFQYSGSVSHWCGCPTLDMGNLTLRSRSHRSPLIRSKLSRVFCCPTSVGSLTLSTVHISRLSIAPCCLECVLPLLAVSVDRASDSRSNDRIFESHLRQSTIKLKKSFS